MKIGEKIRFIRLEKGYDAGISEGQTAMEWVYRELDGYSFTKAEHFLIGAFSKLNTDGQSVAVERVEELTEIPKYQRTDSPPEPIQDPPEDKK